MSSATTKAGLVILPNNCAVQSTCALCGQPDRMTIPFDSFTSDGAWACGDCAAREWGRETVEALHGVGVNRPLDEGTRAGANPLVSDWQMRVTPHGFSERNAALDDGELLRITIRDGMGADLARIIVQEVLRRYADSDGTPF